MRLDINAIISGTGCQPSTALAWEPFLSAAADKYEINTAERVAAWLANVGVESCGMTVFSENLNYSAARLAEVWRNRYARVPLTNPIKPNQLALSLAGKPEAIANNVYASRMGNGPEASGDGWKYRGRGPIQLTGRDVYSQFYKDCGLDVVSSPDLLFEPMGGALSAAWFFAKYKPGLRAADAGNFALTVSLVNGAFPNPTNNGALRISRYNAALRVLKAVLK